MNTFSYGAFVSPHGGLGGPPSFFGLLIYLRRDRAVGSGGFLSFACYCLSLLRGWCVAYVGDASVCVCVLWCDVCQSELILTLCPSKLRYL
jgi:hypothetical protein